MTTAFWPALFAKSSWRYLRTLSKSYSLSVLEPIHLPSLVLRQMMSLSVRTL